MINIGDFDTKVTFQEPTVTRGDQGERIQTWEDVVSPFVKVDRTVAENITDDNLESGRTLTLSCYKVAGMNTRWRVLIDGDPFGIANIEDQGRMSPFVILTLRAIDG